MIWEFWEFEKYHGQNAKGYDPQLNGWSRSYVFHNEPKKQRRCKCQNCGTSIPREVPRVELLGSYYHKAGYYCLSCATRELKEKQNQLDGTVKELQKTIADIEKLLDISGAVMQNVWYPKKMALERMIQVVTGKDQEYDTT